MPAPERRSPATSFARPALLRADTKTFPLASRDDNDAFRFGSTRGSGRMVAPRSLRACLKVGDHRLAFAFPQVHAIVHLIGDFRQLYLLPRHLMLGIAEEGLC